MAIVVASPATAQLAGIVALDSDYRLRGYSLSNDQPAASAQVTYDHASGVYVTLTGLAELGRDTRFLGVIANAGYSKRLSDRLTLDAGVLRYQLRSAAGAGSGYRYSELYAGAYVGPVSAHVYYSPHYRTGELPTLYAEVDGSFEPADKWRLSGHVGILTYLKSSYFYGSGDTHRDWRVSLARRLGRFEVHSALSGGGPSTYYHYRLHKQVAFTAGASVGF